MRPPTLLAAALLAVLVVAGLLPGAPATAREPVDRPPAAASPATDCRGARAFVVEGCDPLQVSGPVAPRTSRAAADRPDVYARGCIAKPPAFRLVTCELARSRGRLHVALLGNSLASQWADALGRIGRDRGWRVTTYLASQCPPSALDVPVATFADPAASYRCRRWAEAVRARMVRQGVDVVVVSSAAGAYPDAVAAEQGFVDYLAPLTEAGVLVETVRRTPQPTLTLDASPATCLRRHVGDYLACSATAGDWDDGDPLHAAGARLRPDRSGQVDLGDLVCTPERCVTVAGGVLLYRDGIHLTRTYVDTLRPYLDERLLAAVRADRWAPPAARLGAATWVTVQSRAPWWR